MSYFDNIGNREKPLVWIGTLGKDGNPHVVPTSFVRPLEGGRKIAVGGVFIVQTVKNLEKHPKVSLSSAKFSEGYDGYLIKGTAKIVREGKEFDEFKKMIHDATKGRRTIKWMIVVDVDRIYSLKPIDGRKRVN